MDTGYAQKKWCQVRNRGVSPEEGKRSLGRKGGFKPRVCLLYTSDAADE